MNICIYCEPLTVFTSANPGRGMLRELISLRNKDQFILVLRRGTQHNPVIKKFLHNIKDLKNWNLVIERVPRKLSNLKSLLRLPHYCNINVKADIYLNMDCQSLGKNSHPLIVTLADLSVFKGYFQASYKKKWEIGLRKFVLRNGVEQADKIIVISQSTRDDLNNILHVPETKTQIVYNGIGEEWFQNMEAVLRLSEGNQPYWIWYGVISNRKNIDNLLKAYSLLKQQEPSVLPKIKLIYANDMVPENISSLITSSGLENDVVLETFKPLNELIAEVSLSMGLLFPSHMEGFGLPVIEAFARGVPVLTSNTPALREISQGLAVLCEPDAVESIKDGLQQLMHEAINSPEKVTARKNRAACFTYQQAARAYSDIIHRITEQQHS